MAVASKGRKRKAPASRQRGDLQGLRAVAVLAVALSHAGVSFLRGGFVGVDVFFVLSGFLITGVLLRSAARHDYVSLREFYARRAKRILPAATLTLIATDLAAYWLLNFVRAKQAVSDSVSAALFFANVHFANRGTNYFAASQPPSPLQHFWTLAVEEQFYIVWPLLTACVIFGVAALKPRPRRRHHHRRSTIRRAAARRLLVAYGVIFAASLTWSILQTASSPTSAYFSTFTRAWELSLGGLIAVVAPRLLFARRERLRAAAGWGGFIAIVVASVAYSNGPSFPGAAALVPTLGAAAIIVAGLGRSANAYGVGRFLALAPMRYIGDRSYAFYLWHWPFLIIASARVGHPLPLTTNLLLLGCAFGLSIVTYKLYENPLHRARLRRGAAAVFATGSVAAVVLVAAVETTALRAPSATSATTGTSLTTGSPVASRSEHSGSKPTSSATAIDAALPAVVESVRRSQQRIPVADLSPSIGEDPNDYYALPNGCFANVGQTTSGICRFGDVSSPRVLIVFGDSHAEMWMPAILPMAERDHWAVVPLVKLACDPDQWISQSSPQCREWLSWALRQARELHPRALLVGGYYSGRGGRREQQAGIGIAQVATSAAKFTHRVIEILDAPGERQQPVDCLLRPGATRASCSYTHIGAGAIADGSAYDLISRVRGVRVIDPSPWFCFQEICPTVIGNTIAYIDQNHVTKTYAAELAAPFREAFVYALRGR